jgi:sugar phosphate permease
MLMVDHPSDVGLPAYGESKVDKPITQRNSLVFTLANPLITLVAVTKSSAFWILSGSFFVCGLSTVGLVLTHWIPICGDFGITPVAAAGTLAVVGVFDFIGTIIAGWLSDRYDNRILLFCFYGVRVLTLGYLSFSSFGVIDLSFFAIVYGLDWVATVPPTVRLVADNFGREKAGLVFGWILASHQLGAAIAAYSAGVLKNDFGTYMPALQITALLCMLAALSVLFLRGPRYEDKVLAT